MKQKKTPYSERSDSEKLKANWTKALGLFERQEYSMAILRAGTCAEIAANIVVRSELAKKRKVEQAFVDKLLRWANGLQGKYERLIDPLVAGTPQQAKLRKLRPRIKRLNDTRNAIAHQGEFTNSKKAHEILLEAHQICSGFVKLFDSSFKLKKPPRIPR